MRQTRTFSVILYEKERKCSTIYTAEEFKFCDCKLWLFNREIGNLCINIEPFDEITITQDREEEE